VIHDEVVDARSRVKRNRRVIGAAAKRSWNERNDFGAHAKISHNTIRISPLIASVIRHAAAAMHFFLLTVREGSGGALQRRLAERARQRDCCAGRPPDWRKPELSKTKPAGRMSGPRVIFWRGWIYAADLPDVSNRRSNRTAANIAKK
jgi:hypothetical protein